MSEKEYCDIKVSDLTINPDVPDHLSNLKNDPPPEIHPKQQRINDTKIIFGKVVTINSIKPFIV